MNTENTQQMSTLQEISIHYSPGKETGCTRRKISCSRDAEQVLRPVFPSLEHREYFYMICLSRSNTLLGYYQVSAGGISGTITDLRLIFQAALKSSASALIVSHNHPSGNLKPSEADIKITKKLRDAGKLLVGVLDHLILTADSYYSFADENTF